MTRQRSRQGGEIGTGRRTVVAAVACASVVWALGGCAAPPKAARMLSLAQLPPADWIADARLTTADITSVQPAGETVARARAFEAQAGKFAGGTVAGGPLPMLKLDGAGVMQPLTALQVRLVPEPILPKLTLESL